MSDIAIWQQTLIVLVVSLAIIVSFIPYMLDRMSKYRFDRRQLFR